MLDSKTETADDMIRESERGERGGGELMLDSKTETADDIGEGERGGDEGECMLRDFLVL
jgi:hypothetical protein